MKNKIVKEIFLIILLFIVIIGTLFVIFYDYIMINNEKIVSISYITDSNVEMVLKEIEEKNNNDSEDNESNSLLKTYSINANDLNMFSTEKYYESGKANPFSEISE